MAKEMSPVQILRAYFGDHPDGRKFMAEMKELSTDERRELAELAAPELGVTIKASPAKTKKAA